MNTNTKNDYTDSCHIYFERTINVSGYSYLVIFGTHINGGFICIPNWKISCEASNLPYSKDYNMQHLITAGISNHAAGVISEQIEHFLEEEVNNESKKGSYLSLY